MHHKASDNFSVASNEHTEMEPKPRIQWVVEFCRWRSKKRRVAVSEQRLTKQIAICHLRTILYPLCKSLRSTSRKCWVFMIKWKKKKKNLTKTLRKRKIKAPHLDTLPGTRIFNLISSAFVASPHTIDTFFFSSHSQELTLYQSDYNPYVLRSIRRETNINVNSFTVVDSSNFEG